ncbi:MAG TPA: 4-hydroxythreonine-4-phosphate dehydrogenase PdxA [Candidatus Paceibacterota bacterium]|nr:4-hydroxythreonine-4-phosphate dehydrogenase PdxA [Verrucomicrobiota bacterium]HSA12407.1 4-hydroxythreonine-4-phosphate dehydrogenase PdxA [Candidatus Paceibacterota bacterium]
MRIGISLGDITGIGPEVTLKALALDAQEGDTSYLLIGDTRHTLRLNEQLGLKLPLQPCAAQRQAGRFALCQPLPDVLPENPAPGSPAAARAAVAWVREGAERCLRRELAALVTAPVNKEAIVRSGQTFVGQTEMLSQLAGTQHTAMMLLGQDDRGRWLRVALATTHLPIKHVSDHLTKAKIEMVIELAAQACRDLGLPRARIAVCGLNPHAGEGGEMGTEEQTTITPAVNAARSRQMDVTGPLAADALFYHAFKGEFDAVVAMYHDQGLAPLKMVAFESGVNWTLGLPFIRTSPDHGTAYDIAGQGKANPSSMLAAIRLARQLASRKRPREEVS